MPGIAGARSRRFLDPIGRQTAHGIVAMAAALAAACGGGDGSSPAPAPVSSNLTARTIQVVSATPTIGYPMDISATIASTVAKDEVSVTLYAIDKDVPDEQRRQIPLGTRTIARVAAGEAAYRLSYDIPTNVEGPRAYYIGMIVNAAGNVEDSNPDDNTATTATSFVQPPNPNIFIKEASLDGNVIPLDTRTYAEQVAAENGVHNADAGVTIYVGAQGAKAPVALQGYAKLRMVRTDTGAMYEVPLYLWDSDAQRYTNAFAVNPAASEPEWLSLGSFTPQLVEQIAVGAEVDVASNELDRKSAHLDLYFPGKLASEFEKAVRHFPPVVIAPTLPPPDLSQAEIDRLISFLRNLPASTDPANPYDEGPAMRVLNIQICAQIRPLGFQDRDAGDNEVCTPVTLVLPALTKPPPDYPVPPPPEDPKYKKTNPILYNKAYVDRWGGRAFSVGVSFSGQATADNRGLIAALNGSVPVVLFGLDLKFVEANARAQVMPDYVGAPTGQTPGVHMDLRILGTMIEPPFDSASITKTGTLGGVSKKWEKSKTFTVGPVPLTVSGFVMGEAGIDYVLGVTDTRLSMKGGPYAQIEAGATGAVGLPGFGAGIEGYLQLIKEEFILATEAALSVVDNGYTTGKAHLVLTPSLDISNIVTGPTGAIYLFAEYSYPTVRRCSWGLFTGICPAIRRAKERLTLDSFRTFRKTDTLLHMQGNITLFSYKSGEVGYYAL